MGEWLFRLVPNKKKSGLKISLQTHNLGWTSEEFEFKLKMVNVCVYKISYLNKKKILKKQNTLISSKTLENPSIFQCQLKTLIQEGVMSHSPGRYHQLC